MHNISSRVTICIENKCLDCGDAWYSEQLEQVCPRCERCAPFKGFAEALAECNAKRKDKQ